MKNLILKYFTVPSSGTPVQFKPTFDVETTRVVKAVTTIHQCINMMKEYSGKSLEVSYIFSNNLWYFDCFAMDYWGISMKLKFKCFN